MFDKSGPVLVYWERRTGEPVIVQPEWAFSYLGNLFKSYRFDEAKGVWGFVEDNEPGNRELRYIAQLRKGDTERTWNVEFHEHPPEVKLLLLLAK